MDYIEAEIFLQNGFPNHNGRGSLLVGTVSKGKIHSKAVLLIEGGEIEMFNIKCWEDNKWNVSRIEFEIEKNLSPSIEWWKYFKTTLRVKTHQ